MYQLGFRPADPERAAALLEENPGLAAECPFAVGDVSGFAAATPPLGMPPLIAVTFSSLIRLERFAPALRRAAEFLLEAGADPNQTWTNPEFPQWPLSALYGAAGLNHDPGTTRILLERGADPNDGESLYHSVESPDTTCTRLLLDAGADVKEGNAIAHVLDYDDIEGLRLLLAHKSEQKLDRELVHAIRRRRSPAHFRELLNAGAPLEGFYRLAMLNGLPEVARLVSSEPLTETELFVAACARADRAEAERILAGNPGILMAMAEEHRKQLPNLAQAGCTDAVRLMVELGWPIDIRGGDIDGSALNHAVFRGDADLTRFLLARGADWRVRHGYNDNVIGTLSFASKNGWPGSLECAKALIEGGVPLPDERHKFSPDVAEYFNELRRTASAAAPSRAIP